MRWCAVGESHDKIFLRSQAIPLVTTFNFSNVALVIEKEIIAFHKNGDGMETLRRTERKQTNLIQFRIVCIFLTLAGQKLYKRPLAIVNSSCCLKLFVDNNIPRIVLIHTEIKKLFLSKLSFIFLLFILSIVIFAWILD